MGRGRSLGVLTRSHGYAALLTARAVSLVGDGVGNLALVVHVQRTEGTGTAVGVLLLAASLPRLLSPLAGTVADRVDRRLVLVAGELAQGVVVGVVLVWLPSLPGLFGLLLLKALLVTVAEPAGQSAVPALVADPDLVAANALVGGVREAGEVLGPLLGGLLVAVAGVRAGLAVDALTFVVSVPLLLRLPRLAPSDAARDERGVTAGALSGLRYTFGDPVVRALTVGFFLAGLAAADDVALPFLARMFGAGERGIGALYAAVGGGLIVGYLLLTRWRRRPSPGRRGPNAMASLGFVVGMAVAAVGNVLTGLAPGLVAAVAFQMVRGLGVAVTETMLQTLIQRTVPRQLLGRVFANVYGAVNLGACLALVAGGPLLDATSARVVLVASGGVGLVGAVRSTRLLRRPGRTPE